MCGERKSVCVCVYVYVCELKREKECVSMYVCVCVVTDDDVLHSVIGLLSLPEKY